MLKRTAATTTSALTERKDYSWPGGKRLAVLLLPQRRVVRFRRRASATTPGAAARSRRPSATIAGATTATASASGACSSCSTSSTCPRAAHQQRCSTTTARRSWRPSASAATRSSAHGRTNAEHQGDMWQPDEERIMREATAAIASHEGARRRAGWRPCISRAARSPDLLKEAGYRYLMDWPMDDQPVWLRTRSARSCPFPYPHRAQRLARDRPRGARRRSSSATNLVDQFDEMLEQCAAPAAGDERSCCTPSSSASRSACAASAA